MFASHNGIFFCTFSGQTFGIFAKESHLKNSSIAAYFPNKAPVFCPENFLPEKLDQVKRKKCIKDTAQIRTLDPKIRSLTLYL